MLPEGRSSEVSPGNSHTHTHLAFGAIKMLGIRLRTLCHCCGSAGFATWTTTTTTTLFTPCCQNIILLTPMMQCVREEQQESTRYAKHNNKAPSKKNGLEQGFSCRHHSATQMDVQNLHQTFTFFLISGNKAMTYMS